MARKIFIDDEPQNDPGGYYRVEVRHVPVGGSHTSWSVGNAPPPPKTKQFAGMRFSSKELEHLGISVLVLTIAFAIALGGGIRGYDSGIFPYRLLIAIIAVAPAFVLHEMAHKYMAQSYGCWSEFRYWGFGLMFAFLTSFVGVMFAAPGAVYFQGRVTREENGKISAAGPATNLVIATVFLAIGVLGRSSGNDFVGIMGSFACFINLFLAGFNLIPFGMFDGAKIFDWDKGVYMSLWMALGLIALVRLTKIPYGIGLIF